MPGSDTDFDLVVRAAIWSGQAAALISVALIVWILALRTRFKARAERTDAFVTAWRPVLAEATMAPESVRALPAFDRRDLEPFLREWNAIHDAVTSASRPGLRALARRLAIVDDVRALLRSKRLPSRALATAAAGHLKDAQSWRTLLAQLDSDNHVLSLLSARALVEIDPVPAVREVIPRIVSRGDWPAGRVAALLRQAGPEAVGEPLCAAIAAGTAEEVIRWLPFVNEAPAPLAAKTLATLMRDSPDERVLSECLRVLSDPSLLPFARRHLRHPQWFVRLLAVEALGRIGERDDVERIASLLTDEQWWVRYRAAQALAQMPWLDAGDLAAIHDRQQDRFAREILEQAIAELKFQ